MSEYFVECLIAGFMAFAISMLYYSGREAEAVVLFTVWMA
jgi:hypothetical protein